MGDMATGMEWNGMEAIVTVPGHALHEKGLQGQKGDGPLVSSQEERALLVPLIPGHALHEKGLQRQISDGTLVNSQQAKSGRGPSDKLRIDRWSIGRFVPPLVYIGFPLFVLAKKRPGQFFTVRWRARGAVGSQGDRNVGILFCSASPHPAVRPAPCRPDPPVVCPGFGLDR